MIIYPFETMWKDITKYIRRKNIKKYNKKYTSPQIKVFKSPTITHNNNSFDNFMKMESPWTL